MILGLFIGRLNPPHIWHIATIDTALQDNEQVCILLWSLNIKNAENPLTFSERKKLLQEKYSDQKKLQILGIEDFISDEEWVKEIYNILTQTYQNIEKISFYGGDFENDSAYRVVKRYQDIFWSIEIEYIEKSRKNSFIQYEGQKILVSATELRKALQEKNILLAESMIDASMQEGVWKYFL